MGFQQTSPISLFNSRCWGEVGHQMLLNKYIHILYRGETRSKYPSVLEVLVA